MLGQHSRTLGLGPERAMLFDQLFAGAHSPRTSLGSYRPLGPPGGAVLDRAALQGPIPLEVPSLASSIRCLLCAKNCAKTFTCTSHLASPAPVS